MKTSPTQHTLDVSTSPASGAAASGRAVPPPVIPVSLLVSSARLILERHLPLAWISGEISNFTRAASGHCYFNLKDATAQVRCVFFRQKAQFAGFALKDGLAVEVRATPSIFEARGEFQLNVETVRLAGIGALYEKFERLKARLAAAGWFAAERKRQLPAFPRRIGIVTSLRAAALSDILTTLRRRWSSAAVILYPAMVQGEGAAADIARAIATASARGEVDVLIVARGGGSIEDLWAFNEEVVARAIIESSLPIVSGVGHETDFTICDFTADARAPTPTAAATLVVPDGRALRTHVAGIARRWRRASIHALQARQQRVDGLSRRLVHPAAHLARQRKEAVALASRRGGETGPWPGASRGTRARPCPLEPSRSARAWLRDRHQRRGQHRVRRCDARYRRRRRLGIRARRRWSEDHPARLKRCARGKGCGWRKPNGA